MKYLISIAFYFCLLLFAGLDSQAQSHKEFSLIKTLFTPPPKTNYKQFAKENNNQLESTFSVLFLAYKNFISSQDMDVCVFQPSCSVYAIECIHHEKNKVIAFLKVSDRLMRCHPLVEKGSYSIDFKTGKYLDPIEK